MSFPFLAALSYRAVDAEYVSTKTFRIGTLGMTEDGSLFRLCKAGAAINNTTRAKIGANRHLSGLTGESLEASLASAITVGDTDFTITDATNSRTADYYKDGYYAEPRSDGNGTRVIWKSDAEVSDTYKMYVTSPFTIANASGNTVHTYPNPWNNIKNAMATAQNYEVFVGGVMLDITNGYYFWVKVRGPFWMARNSTWPGAVADDRDVVYHTNGTVKMRDESTNANQRAGYLISSGAYGDVFIMLEQW